MLTAVLLSFPQLPIFNLLPSPLWKISTSYWILNDIAFGRFQCQARTMGPFQHWKCSRSCHGVSPHGFLSLSVCHNAHPLYQWWSWLFGVRPASHRSSRPAQLHIRYRPDLRSLLCPRHISSVLLACQKESNEEIQLLRGRLAWTSVLPWTCPPWRGDCRHWRCKCSMECLGVPLSWYYPALHSLSHNHSSQKKQGLDEQHAT